MGCESTISGTARRFDTTLTLQDDQGNILAQNKDVGDQSCAEVYGGVNQWWIEDNELTIEWSNVAHYGGGFPVTFYLVLSLTTSSPPNHPNEGQIKIICQNCTSDEGLHTQGVRGPYPNQGFVFEGRAQSNWSINQDEVIFTPRFTE